MSIKCHVIMTVMSLSFHDSIHCLCSILGVCEEKSYKGPLEALELENETEFERQTIIKG